MNNYNSFEKFENKKNPQVSLYYISTFQTSVFVHEMYNKLSHLLNIGVYLHTYKALIN